MYPVPHGMSIVLPAPHVMAAVPWMAMGVPPPPMMQMAPPPSQSQPPPSPNDPDPVLALFEVLSDPGVDAAVCRRTLRRLGPHAGRLLTMGGDTLLHHAAKRGRVDLVRVLVEPPVDGEAAVDAAARADMLGWRNHEGHTALHAALAAEQEACSLVLVHVGGAEARKAPTGTQEGVPPIVMAAATGLPVVVRALLAYGITLETRDARGWGPLHAACAAGREEMVRWLVDERGADPQAVDERGCRPHDLAMKHGHAAVFAFMHARLTGRMGARAAGASKPPVVPSAPAVVDEEERRRKQKEKRQRRKQRQNELKEVKALVKTAEKEGDGGGKGLAVAVPNVQQAGEERGDEDGVLASSPVSVVGGDLIVLRGRAFSQERGLSSDGDDEEEEEEEEEGLEEEVMEEDATPSSLSLSGVTESALDSGPPTAEALIEEEAGASAATMESGLFHHWRPGAREEAAAEQVGADGAWSLARVVVPSLRSGVGAGGDCEEEEDDDEEEASLEALLRARAPAEFLCPLSGSLMRNAVVAMDACAYEQGALEGYMEACANEGKPLTSPSTGEAMAALIVPHFTLRKMVGGFVEETRREWALMGNGGGRRR